MLDLKMYMEFVVDHRKLRKMLWPPGVLLENGLKNKEKLSLAILTVRGAITDDAGPILSFCILFLF